MFLHNNMVSLYVRTVGGRAIQNSTPFPKLILTLVCTPLPSPCQVVLFRRIPIKITDFHNQVVAYLRDIAFKVRLEYFHCTPTMHTRSSPHGDQLRYLIVQTEVVEVVVENHGLQHQQKVKTRKFNHLGNCKNNQTGNSLWNGHAYEIMMICQRQSLHCTVKKCE